MWKRCTTPKLSKKAKCTLLSNRLFNYKDHKRPTYVAYPRGCTQIILVTEPKKPTTTPKLKPPKGSYGKEETPRTHDSLTWEEVITKLKETTWNQKSIEWWQFSDETKKIKFLPVLTKKRYIMVDENQTGLQALRKIGIVGLNIVPHTEAWNQQISPVRVFWRGIFAYLCEMSPTVRISEYYMTQLKDYATRHLPRLFTFPKKYYPFARNYDIDEPQFGFFARLFDAAVRVKRLKIQGIWGRTDIVEAKRFIKRAHTYVKEKWPFIHTDETTFFLDTFVDSVCEKLWYDDWPADSKIPFAENNIWTVFADYACESEFVQILEAYTPDTEQSNMQSCYQNDVDEFAILDLTEVSDHIYKIGLDWAFHSTSRRVSRTFVGHACPEVYLEVSDVQFKRMRNKQKFVDPNWISIPKTIIPRIIRKTRISIPALPILPNTEERLLELLLPTLLHDEFLLRCRRWYDGVPVFIEDLDCYHFNSSYYGFSRHRMIIYFSDVIRN